MSFRRKLLSVFALTVFLSVAAVTWLVLLVTRNAFEKSEDQRTTALVTQFQREFGRRGDDVARRVEAIATSNPVSRMATDLNATPADPAEYFELARQLADAYQLDFLEFLDEHGSIISSAQWPAKFGYPDNAFESLSSANGENAFLKREELQDSTALGLFAVRATHGGWTGISLPAWSCRRICVSFSIRIAAIVSRPIRFLIRLHRAVVPIPGGLRTSSRP
jgi:two-component system, NtrC family, nitrogen regulation sensor histidine kinase NtrY